jgi:hypothetical protein
VFTLVVEMAQLCIGALGAAANAEQRFAALVKAHDKDVIPKGRDTPDTFVVRQNIARYRELIAGGHLDAIQLSVIEKLLVEEEEKLAAHEP